MSIEDHFDRGLPAYPQSPISMMPSRLTTFACLFALALGSTLPAAASSPPNQDPWKAVEEAIGKGLPKTAIERLDPIIEASLATGNHPQAVLALGTKISLEGDIQGKRAEERITRLEETIPDWPEATHPILETVLAHWYWSFFQQNQWRFLERTRTAESPGEDILSWDLPRILAEIDAHFSAALANPKALEAIPIQSYDPLLKKGSIPDSYRPTLYDFIAHEALRFYQAGEQAGSTVRDAFVLDADSPALGSTEEFLAWEIETTDTASPKLKAALLLQDLLETHRAGGADRNDAFLDTELARILWAESQATGENLHQRACAALERFANDHADHPLSARARARWAKLLQTEEDPAAAHRVATVGAEAFPNSPGGRECHNLIKEIEHPHSQLQVERIWNSPMPAISLEYRNLEKTHFRLVRRDWVELTRQWHWRMDQVDQKFLAELIAQDPVAAWSVDLSATADFKDRIETIPVPEAENLAPGHYFILASHHEDFSRTQDNTTHYLGCWVSELALITRGTWQSGQVSGLVLHAITGEPVAGAEITAYRRQDHDTRESVGTTTSDADGLFSLEIPEDGYRQIALHAEHGDQAIATRQEISIGHPRREPGAGSRSFFFTDRSIYRPGQTISFKAIAVRYNQGKNDYQVLPDREFTIRFRDANGQEIASQKLRSNRFGSLHGHFTAPRDRLTGRMRISIDGGAPGQAVVNVEEYKRPKFRVELAPPETPARLDDDAAMTGSATAYTGAAIDGAEVSYRVVRQVRFPGWYRWCFWPPLPPVPPQEIAQGTTTTATDGSFRITFPTRPDPEVSPEHEPVFQFVVHADVTDATGETRSAERIIRVGYTALQAELRADAWQEKGKPIRVTASTRSLDGEPLAAEGTVTVHRLDQPERVQRKRLGKTGDNPDLSSPASWELAEAVTEKPFQTDTSGGTTLDFELEPGHYRAVLATEDRFGKKVAALLPITVLDPDADDCPLVVPNHVAAPHWQLEPGEEFRALWGTGYDEGRAFIEIAHRGRTIRSHWTNPGRTQQEIVLPVTEELRGGFTLRVTQVRENRAYLTEQQVSVPWTNKNLQVRWERFTSKLEPGEKETWTAIVSGPDAEQRAIAEVAAVLYDESLDAFLPHNWPGRLGVFYHDNSRLNPSFHNRLDTFHHGLGNWRHHFRHVDIRYRSLPPRLRAAGSPRFRSFGRVDGLATAAAPMAAMAAEEGAAVDAFAGDVPTAMRKEAQGIGAAESPQAPQGPDLDQVTVRKNLQETAFFFPAMTTGEDGTVRIEFTAPEALTSWKLMAFAHDTELRSGQLRGSAVTTKDILVQPNPPRFLREADTLEFTVKVVNTSPTTQAGSVRLALAEARTGDSADTALGNTDPARDFEIPANESRTFAWKLTVPDGTPFLTYRAVASTGRLSDGEQGFLPVLPRRILVTESLPLPIRDAGSHAFEFEKLLTSGDSDSLRHESLTLQMVSNPAWYAVMALPYLMEFPHQCSEQVFSRLYANALARHIATSDPKIRRVFDQWQAAGGDTLESPLEKNEDLKQLALEETPWVRDADKESTARRNLGLLFDANRLDSEIARAARQLAEQQRDDGAWPWFPGGPASDHITLHITTGLARLRHLGVHDVDLQPALRALGRLDNWIDETYRRILEHPDTRESNHLTPTIALYLYGRSFYLDDKAIDDRHREAVDYFLGQAGKYWLKLGNRQSQAHLALALQRFGKDRETPRDILASLREHAVTDEELGMFWRDTELSWWWYRAPIETQALMIEAFDEVAKDPAAVEDLKIWLLKQKQTRDWKTTKATADAVYALLLRGTDLLASDALVRVKLGEREIEPQNVEAGTGFYQQRLQPAEITPAMGSVTVTKEDPGVAWGALHWQYLESIDKITPHEATPLKLVKKLFKKEHSDQGPLLHAVKPGDPLFVGDELVVRLELRSDRDMEYLHLKDQRGAGTEPTDVLSQYRYRDGLACYQSTRDTASHFFIDYLPKGTYVFEYSLRVQHRGRYHTGMASIQCMYAPEFNSHSQSFLTTVE